jgi:hypothetical protein
MFCLIHTNISYLSLSFIIQSISFTHSLSLLNSLTLLLYYTMTTRSGRSYQPAWECPRIIPGIEYIPYDPVSPSYEPCSPVHSWGDTNIKEEVTHGEDPAGNECMDYSTESGDEGNGLCDSQDKESRMEDGVCSCGRYNLCSACDQIDVTEEENEYVCPSYFMCSQRPYCAECIADHEFC